MSGLEELRRLEAAATRGPWEVIPMGDQPRVQEVGFDAWLAITSSDPGAKKTANAEFIVAARNELPRILDALDAVLATTYESDDGSEYEHNRDCEGEPTCPACWATDIRAAITKALEGAGHE